MPLMKISPELEAIIGVKEATRPEVIRRTFAYLEKNNLFDPENKRIIMCDDKMKKLTGGEIKIRAFGLAKHFSKHMS